MWKALRLCILAEFLWAYTQLEGAVEEEAPPVRNARIAQKKEQLLDHAGLLHTMMEAVASTLQTPISHLTPPDAPLRFEVGDVVMCGVPSLGLQLGKVLQVWYREFGWPAGKLAPYQLQLPGGEKVYAPRDDDDCVRPASGHCVRLRGLQTVRLNGRLGTILQFKSREQQADLRGKGRLPVAVEGEGTMSLKPRNLEIFEDDVLEPGELQALERLIRADLQRGGTPLIATAQAPQGRPVPPSCPGCDAADVAEFVAVRTGDVGVQLFCVACLVVMAADQFAVPPEVGAVQEFVEVCCRGL